MAHNNPFDLTGQAAIVTGAAMGIGFGVAQSLQRAGADVLIADIDQEAANAAAQRLAGEGSGRVAAIGVDVSADVAGELLTTTCVKTFGHVDILVNNAAVFPVAPFLETTPEIFDRTMMVNVRAVYFLTQRVARNLISQGSGVIINIASREALRVSFPGLSAYGISKAALSRMTMSMAAELGPHGIRAVAIAPGGIATEGTAKLGASGLLPEAAETAATSPLGRRGRPDDIADVVVFLASPAAKWITGDLLLVEGGALLS